MSITNVGLSATHSHILINHNVILKCLLMVLLLFMYITMSLPSLQLKNG